MAGPSHDDLGGGTGAAVEAHLPLAVLQHELGRESPDRAVLRYTDTDLRFRFRAVRREQWRGGFQLGEVPLFEEVFLRVTAGIHVAAAALYEMPVEPGQTGDRRRARRPVSIRRACDRSGEPGAPVRVMVAAI